MHGTSDIDRFREGFRSKQTHVARQHALLDAVETRTDIAQLNALIDAVETAKTSEEREMALESCSQSEMGNTRRLRTHFDSMKVGQGITKSLEEAGVAPCRKSRAVLVAGAALHVPAAATKRDAPGGHAAPLRLNKATFSVSPLERAASDTSALPPSPVPGRIGCPCAEGDYTPPGRAADSPVEELQGRWIDELTGFRPANIPKAFHVTGLTFSPSDDPVLRRGSSSVASGAATLPSSPASRRIVRFSSEEDRRPSDRGENLLMRPA
jgi:hypothetical protein